MAIVIYCYQKSNSHGWTDYCFTPNQSLLSAEKGFKEGVTYTLALRKDWTLPTPPTGAKDLLKVTCDEAWVDTRETKVNFNIAHVKNPVFEFVERKLSESLTD